MGVLRASGTSPTARSTSPTRRRRSASWPRIARRGLLYRRKKPVYWCITDQTALAEAEVEYEDHGAPRSTWRSTEPGTPDCSRSGASARDAFRLGGKKVDLRHLDHHPLDAAGQPGDRGAPEARVRLLRARRPGASWWPRTCSPRVLGEIAPGRARGEGRRSCRAARSRRRRSWTRARILGYATGEDLEGFAYQHPFYRPRSGVVVLGEHVTLEAGHRPGAHRAGPRPGGLRGRPPVRARHLQPGERRRPLRRHGAAAELRGDEGLRRQPAGSSQLLVERGALLNAPDRHASSTATRTAGAATTRSSSAPRHQWFIAMDRPGHDGRPGRHAPEQGAERDRPA